MNKSCKITYQFGKEAPIKILATTLSDSINLRSLLNLLQDGIKCKGTARWISFGDICYGEFCDSKDTGTRPTSATPSNTISFFGSERTRARELQSNWKQSDTHGYQIVLGDERSILRANDSDFVEWGGSEISFYFKCDGSQLGTGMIVSTEEVDDRAWRSLHCAGHNGYWMRYCGMEGDNMEMLFKSKDPSKRFNMYEGFVVENFVETDELFIPTMIDKFEEFEKCCLHIPGHSLCGPVCCLTHKQLNLKCYCDLHYCKYVKNPDGYTTVDTVPLSQVRKLIRHEVEWKQFTEYKISAEGWKAVDGIMKGANVGHHNRSEVRWYSHGEEIDLQRRKEIWKPTMLDQNLIKI